MRHRIFVARRIHTFSDIHNPADALLVAGGTIVRSGPVDELRAEAPRAEIIDFGDSVVTPGLTDAHIHITEWALARRQVDLANAVSIDECVRIIGQARTRSEWLQGRGWNPHQWDGSYPDRNALDAVVGDIPAAFQSHDMHALWVNSRALQRAGIDRETPDPAGGRIVRDAAGEPTGMLLETAAQLVVGKIPLPNDQEMLAAVADAQRALHQLGITGIHSFPGVHLPEPDPLPVLSQLSAQGRLALRVLQHISADKLADAIHLGLQSGFGGDWIRIGGVKLFLDGALGSRTAWMRAPYEGSQDCGVQVLQRKEFTDIVMQGASNGVATVVHAIGDAAVAMAFDVLSAAPRVAALPHRVEHVQCFPADHTRFLRAGIICSVQPCHLMTDWRAAERHWGARSAHTYAFRTMLDGGAVLACGSDAPVEPADPRLGLYAAVARRDTHHQPAGGWQAAQNLTPREAWAGYTTGAARAAGAATKQGVLQAGAFADFAVWKMDPFEIAPEALLDLPLAATVVDGEVVYEA